MKSLQTIVLLTLCCVAVAPLQAQTTIGGGTCSPSTLNGTFTIILTGRQLLASGTFAKVFQSNGLVTFDGQNKVSFTLAVNTNQALGGQQNTTGTYTLQPNCTGTVTAAAPSTAVFSLAAFNQGRGVLLTGQDGTYAFNATGTIKPTLTCATSTLSGVYAVSGNGFTLTGAAVTGVVDANGLLQFDGAGKVVATATITTSAGAVATSASGTYTLGSNCVGTGTLVDDSKTSSTLSFVITSATGADFDLLTASPTAIFSGSGRATFTNPGQAVVNAASNIAGRTPAGSLFTIYGSNLTSKAAQASTVPLPTTLLTTKVTVNGEAAPLFFADQNQINAQMPEDIQPGVATIVVTNGASVSNAVAVNVPAVGSPGIFVYGQNRAVAVNPDVTVNSTASPAKVGDTLIAYFTGGGPVKGSNLVSGAPTPGALYPVTGTNGATLSGKDAPVSYMGLTPGSIGLYQVNFQVPTLAKGDHPLVITIAGQTSNNPLVAVAN